MRYELVIKGVRVICFLRLKLAVVFFSILFVSNLEAGDTSGSSNYRERFSKVPAPEREEPIVEGKEDGGDGGGGSKGGKSRKKKKKKDDVRRVVGPRDPIVPVTGVKTGDLTAVTYKSPTPTAPLLEKAWNSTAWAPTYQPASRSLLGEKGGLEAVIQSDLIKHTGWKVDGDSISISPSLHGGPYDVQTGQPITFGADHEGGSSGGVFGVIGRAASALTWDNPFSVFGPNNPFLIVDRNPLKNPHGIVQVGRRLANYAGVLSAWTFGEGVQITEDGGIGIIHNPSGKQALRAGAGLALWFTPARVFRSAWSAGTRAISGVARVWGGVRSAASGLGQIGSRVWSVLTIYASHMHAAPSGLGGVGNALVKTVATLREINAHAPAIMNQFLRIARSGRNKVPGHTPEDVAQQAYANALTRQPQVLTANMDPRIAEKIVSQTASDLRRKGAVRARTQREAHYLEQAGASSGTRKTKASAVNRSDNPGGASGWGSLLQPQGPSQAEELIIVREVLEEAIRQGREVARRGIPSWSPTGSGRNPKPPDLRTYERGQVAERYMGGLEQDAIVSATGLKRSTVVDRLRELRKQIAEAFWPS